MRVLVVDDHPLVREGLALMIRAARAEAEVVLAGDCAGALSQATEGAFDLAIVDLQLPDQSGLVVIARLRRAQPDLRVVAISGHEDRATVIRALEAGARAFLPKSADTTRLRLAIEAVLADGFYLPDSMKASSLHEAGRGATTEQWPLTGRQLEVLSLLVAGLSNKQIGRRLDIAESTVKIHVTAIFRAFRVNSRTQALIMAARSGLRLPDPAGIGAVADRRPSGQ